MKASSYGMLGKKHSEETKNKMSEVRKGKSAFWNIDRKHSEEHKIKCAHPLEKNGKWKGGRIVDKDGYILIKMPNHLFCNNQGYVREHRFMMEKQIGRYLYQQEVVHHINGNKNDNHIDNLKLMNKNLHASINHGRIYFRYGDIFKCIRCGEKFYRQPAYKNNVKNPNYCSWICRYPNSKKAPTGRPKIEELI